MADIVFEGMDELARMLNSVENAAEEATPQILDEAGSIIAREWETSAEKSGHYITRGLIRHIKPHRKIKNGESYTLIYPDGNHPEHKDKTKRPMRYAAIAFILHYGRSTSPGTRWVTKAEENAKPKLQQMLSQKWEAIMKSKGVD